MNLKSLNGFDDEIPFLLLTFEIQVYIIEQKELLHATIKFCLLIRIGFQMNILPS
jgi:hypothetical protein